LETLKETVKDRKKWRMLVEEKTWNRERTNVKWTQKAMAHRYWVLQYNNKYLGNRLLDHQEDNQTGRTTTTYYYFYYYYYYYYPLLLLPPLLLLLLLPTTTTTTILHTTTTHYYYYYY
jgi:hypothetical protein